MQTLQGGRGRFRKNLSGLMRPRTVKDVRLMRETVSKDMRVKAVGGIRTFKEALAMIEAGANRIGTNTGAAIIKEIPK